MKDTQIMAFLIFGLITSVGYSQTAPKTQQLSNALSLSLPQYNVTSSGLGLKLGGFKLKDTRSLLLYNKTTGVNDIFSPVYTEEQTITYERTASIILLDNQFRANKIDSFNPYGAESLGQGILVGALNLLFQ